MNLSTILDWERIARRRLKQSGHSLFGPSTLTRNSLCSRSTRFGIENNKLETKDTEYALEGRVAHSLGERTFVYDVSTKKFVGKKFHAHSGQETVIHVIDKEMAYQVQKYVDWCRKLGGVQFVETRVDLSDFSPIKYQIGTADHAALVGTTLYVTDLKYGMEWVDAKENLQLLAYALGFYWLYKDIYPVKKVVLRIAQPRLDSFLVWTLTAEELESYGPVIRLIMLDAMDPNATFQPGKVQCRWCPMSGNCSAEEEFLTALGKAEFESFDNARDGKDVHAFTQAQLDTAYSNIEFLRNWAKRVEQRMLEELSEPKVKSKYMLAEGRRGNAQFDDPDVAFVFMAANGFKKEDIYTEPKLITPTQAKALLLPAAKADLEKNYISRGPGRPTIVPFDKKRKRYTAPLAAEFLTFDNID